MSDFQEKYDWYHITDIMLGINSKIRSMKIALELASKSKHPDAIWLYGIFKERTPSEDIEQISNIFLEHKDDVRGLFFAEAIYLSITGKSPYCGKLVNAAADKGYPYAQGFMIDRTNVFLDQGRVRWLITQSSAAGDRNGYYHYASYSSTPGDKKLYYRKAALLGCTMSMVLIGYSVLNGARSIADYNWNIEAANHGFYFSLLSALKSCIKEFMYGDKDYLFIVFEQGRIVRGHDLCLNACRYDMADINIRKQHDIGANFAAKYYNDVCDKVRKSIVAWILCLKKSFGNSFVNKDIRKKIARLIWANRKSWCSFVPHTNYKLPKEFL